VKTLRLASRPSPLARAQASIVVDLLAARGVTCDVVAIASRGDTEVDRPLHEIAGIGVFAAEVQFAVLDGRADAAVHSAKDLPSITPSGLVIAAVPSRADAADVLVGRSLAGLGPGARVATGSPRRRALLLHARPDLDVVELRGNMARRVAAVGTGGIDAVVTAAAALDRLEWSDRVAERLDPAWFVPQVGQGAIAVEVRRDDAETLAALAGVTDPASARSLAAERAFLRELGAGCAVPAGAHATSATTVSITAVMAALDGSVVLRDTVVDVDAETAGVRVARRLRDELGGRQLDGWREP
jgi:hydroxymethylbilane synthase